MLCPGFFIILLLQAIQIYPEIRCTEEWCSATQMILDGKNTVLRLLCNKKVRGTALKCFVHFLLGQGTDAGEKTDQKTFDLTSSFSLLMLLVEVPGSYISE